MLGTTWLIPLIDYKGLMALFLRTTSAVIALKPLGNDSYRLRCERESSPQYKQNE